MANDGTFIEESSGILSGNIVTSWLEVHNVTLKPTQPTTERKPHWLVYASDEPLGALPNMVLNSTFQKENWRIVFSTFPDLFVRMEEDGPPARIKDSQAIAESQAEGVAVFDSKKPFSRAVWKGIEPVFGRILDLMNGAR